MSSLRTKVEKQLQLCLRFLSPSAIMVRNFDLPLTIKHIDNNSPSLKVYLQKTILKNNVEQVEKQKLGSKINLQKG
jgi:hypothetical protein